MSARWVALGETNPKVCQACRDWVNSSTEIDVPPSLKSGLCLCYSAFYMAEPKPLPYWLRMAGAGFGIAAALATILGLQWLMLNSVKTDLAASITSVKTDLAARINRVDARLDRIETRLDSLFVPKAAQQPAAKPGK